MEERYINMRRRRSEELEDDWDEPPRRTPPSRKAPSHRRGRNAAVSVLMGFYKLLVVVSVVIVAGYVGFRVMVKPPEQAGAVPPAQAGNKTNPSTGGTAVVDPDPDTVEPGRQLRPGVYNILLAATDMGGSLTDVMMVMQYDTAEQKVGVVSVPRDTLTPREKGENPHLVYGKGGVEQRVIDISQMLGVPIDYYIKVNIKGFISLVDYLGGIDFYVPCNMNYDDPIQNLHIHYKEGMTHLTGQQAMEVARFRKNNPDENGRSTGYSDTGRTETQQKLLIALAKKVLSWNSLTKINGFVEIFNQSVDTDLSMNDMLYFASQAVNLDPSTAVSTATLPGRGDAVYHGSRYCYELDPEGTLEMVNQLINPYDQPMTLEDMNLGKAESYK
ncbi:LCP family protein [Pseudoflavonifractor sp. 60]|uniref:LCP family protein n=1 Tax=Pseudoflavonifractor sp. 60 TaxID=2304576 RepID=UPI00325BC64B